MGLFELIKNRVDIISVLEDETGTRVHKTGSTYRLNPCPLCYHNDCFTIYPETNSFDCFSCHQAGDVTTFTRLHKGFEDNLSAAKFLAEKYRISPDDKSEIVKTKRRIEEKTNQAETKPSIDDARANDVRRVAAEFYHGQLLNSEKALEYQTKERGHSLEVLKRFHVGYAGEDSVIRYAVEHGYTVEDLIAVGFVRKAGKGYKAAIPEGTFLYPHKLKDNTLYFSLKIPDQKFQIKKLFAGAEWLCFNQDALESKGPVFIVEGENDLLSVIDRAKQENVIATLGNFNTTNILNYLEGHAKGKCFYLCFDNDDAGRQYTSKYTKAIFTGGGLVKVISLPEGYKDIDDYLQASENPEVVFNSLIEKASEVSDGNKKVTPEINSEFIPYMERFKDSFMVLGEMVDKRISFWSCPKKKIYITSLKDFNLDTLDQIGGEEVRHMVVRSSRELVEGKIHFFALKRDINIEAGKKLLGDELWLGQGVNLLDSGKLLVINGDEALIWDGVSFENYHEPMIEKKFISRDSANKWIDSKTMQKTVIDMDKERASTIFHELLNLVRQWNFSSEYDDSLIAGFFIAQRVQALWSWRPHLWIDGSAGSGKTSLLVFGGKIGGRLSSIYEGQVLSEPGFRQDLKNDFRLNFIDEFEKSESRQEIINLLRSAGRGGSSTKGTSSGHAIRYYIRHMVIIASIERSLARAAERHRFITIEMKKDSSRNPIIPDRKEAEELNLKITAHALWAAFKAKELIWNIGRVGKYERRLVEAYAVPLSIMAVIESEPLEFLRFFTEKVLNDRDDSGDALPEDEERLLDDILSSTVRVSTPESENSSSSVYTERSVLWLLNSSEELHQQDLAAHGIWKQKDGSLFFACEIIRRKLLKDTIWRDLNVTSILKRLPGAEREQAKRNNQYYRGVKIIDNTGILQNKQALTSEKQSNIFR